MLLNGLDVVAIQGYICIAVATIMSVVYIVFARFGRLSFDRRERFVRPAAECMKSISEALDAQIAHLLDEIKKKLRPGKALSPALKVLCFSCSAVALILCTAVYLFLSIMRQVFFSLLIGWKGLDLGSLTLMFSKFIDLVEQLTGVLHIPPEAMRFLFYPFQLICQLADLCNTEDLYKLLTVTCQGAKAPIELFLDSFVLGVSILFINSDYNFLWAMTFQEMNRLSVVKYWIQGGKILSRNFAVAGTALVLTATNPFITILRFLLSFVNFGAFFVNNHLTHSMSKACIGIEGFQNQEMILVDATSLLVWWLIAPMLYSAAEIACPKGGYTATRTSFQCPCGANPVLVTPLITQDQMDNEEDNVSSSLGSVLVSEFRDSDNSSIDTGSIVISEYDDSDSTGLDVGKTVLPKYTTGDDDIVLAKKKSSDNEESPSIRSSYRHSDRISVAVSQQDGSFNRDDVSSGLASDRDEKNDHGENVVGDEIHIHLSHIDSPVSERVPGPTADTDTVTVVTVDSTCTGVRGMVRYAWSSVSLVIGADVLVVYVINAYVAHSQKVGKTERMRQQRANQRWDWQTIQLTIEQFQAERRIRRGSSYWSRCLRFFQQYEAASRAADEALSKKWLCVANESDDSKLPPYYRLCLKVQEELCKGIRVVYSLQLVSTQLSYVLAFSGIGHLLVPVGRQHWLIVLRKYALFFGACLGIWLDETYEAFEVEQLVRDFTIGDPEEVTVQFLPLIIVSRVILLQALGQTTTLISIIVINVCVSPLFVFSPKLRERIPPLLHLNPREVSLKRERMELLGRRNQADPQQQQQVSVEEWVLVTRSLAIFLTESRLIVFLYNLVALSLTLMILKGIVISNRTIALLLIGMLPYYVGLTLLPILYIGKRLDLRDEDFRQVFLGWVPMIFRVARSTGALYRECLGLRPSIVPEQVGWVSADPDMRQSYLCGSEQQPIEIVIGVDDDDEQDDNDDDDDGDGAGDERCAIESNEVGQPRIHRLGPYGR